MIFLRGRQLEAMYRPCYLDAQVAAPQWKPDFLRALARPYFGALSGRQLVQQWQRVQAIIPDFSMWVFSSDPCGDT